MLDRLVCYQCVEEGIEKAISEASIINALNNFSNIIGRPITIQRGYTCKLHQSTNPYERKHNDGFAADIKVDGLTSDQLFELAVAHNEFTVIGHYINTGLVHVEISNGPKRTWINNGNKTYLK